MTANTTTLLELFSASDESLASQATRQPQAFAELYHRHFLRVYRYHLARTGSAVDAQDLTSQTFMAALEGVTGFRGSGSFIAWLMGIARRKTALHYRAQRAPLPLEAADSLADPRPSPEITTFQRLDMAQVYRVLEQLSPDRAEAIRLCIFGELSAAEAGQVMDKSQAAVKMLIHRGLSDLRDRLAPAKQEEK
jgi:RNA polymerase sigma-70 factor (ECF subfamily)